MRRLLFFLLLIYWPACSVLSFSTPDSLAILTAIEDINPVMAQDKDSTFRFLQDLERQSAEINFDRGLATAQFKISMLRWAQTRYDESVRYALEALPIYEKLRDSEMQARVLVHLARTYADLKLLEKAHEIIRKASNFLPAIPDERFHAELYRNVARLHQVEYQFDSVLHYARRAVEIDERQSDTTALAISLSYVAAAYRGRNEMDKWLEHEQRSFKLAMAVDNFRGASISAGRLADYYLSVSDVREARYYAREALRLSRVSGFLRAAQTAYEVLDSVAVLEADFAAAHRYRGLASQLRDSIYSTERARIVAELQSNFEIKQRDKEIALLEKDRMLRQEERRMKNLYLMFSLLAVVLLGAAVIALVSRSRIKGLYTRSLEEKNREIELQKREIEEQAAELRELNEAKTKLFSIVSHDLRNSIGGLKAVLDMLGDRSLSREEFMSISETLKSSTDAVHQLMENLLEWSVGQMDGFTTHPQVFNIAELIEQTQSLIRENSHRKRIQVVNEGPNQVLVKADPKQIDVVLRNLLVNAVKFTPEGGRIEVGVRAEPSSVASIFVRDNGIGMDKDELARIFGRNGYHSRPGTMHEKGTGLGLQLCMEFVEKNGGKLHVESVPGRGTTFWFQLPLAS